MTLTPETLPRHELVGLHVRVVESTDRSRVGIEGEVVRETTRTLVVGEEPRSSNASGQRGGGAASSGTAKPSPGPRADTDSGASGSDGDASGVKQVPKRGTTFEFRLTDEAAAPDNGAGTSSQPAGGESQTTGEDAAYVTVDGVALLSRPATRSENGVDSKWR